MRVTNITPDVLSVPALARIVQPGDTVEVPTEQDGAVRTCVHCGQAEDGHRPAAQAGHEFEADDSHRLTWPPGMWELARDTPAPTGAQTTTEAGE